MASWRLSSVGLWPRAALSPLLTSGVKWGSEESNLLLVSCFLSPLRYGEDEWGSERRFFGPPVPSTGAQPLSFLPR